MKKHSKFTLILMAVMSLALFSTACEDQKKIDEANKFVDSANKKADEVKGLVSKAASAFEGINSKLNDFEEDKAAHENEIKDLVKSYDKILDLQKGIASDYTEAAKLNANEKFKAYYEVSAKDAQKTGEVLSQSKATAQAILDSNDFDSFKTKMDGITAKSDSLKKESDGLRAQLSKLETDVKALNK